MEFTAFKKVMHLSKGKKPTRLSKIQEEGCMPYVDIKAFEEGIIDNFTDGEKCLPCRNGDILIVCDGSRSGMVGKAINGYVGSTLALISADGMSTDFLYYFLQGQYLNLNTKKRGTGTPHLDKEVLGKQKLVIPPLIEQRHIVSRIEELFSELDNSVSTLQKTKEQLAVYRQAVLKEAFDSVKCVGDGARVKDVCNNIKVGIVIKPTQYYVERDGIKAFRNANVRRNHVDDNNWALISKEGHEKNKKSIVHTNDLVIARSGVNLGMAAVVPEKCEGFNAIDIVIAELNLKVVDPHYLAYYINSPYGLHVVNEYQHGGAQGHLNVKEFGLLPLILAPISEQKRVVTEIESRLSVCDSIERTVDTALQQAEAMRQSILKQAFEGRL